MNANVVSEDAPRYEKLSQPRERVDKNNNVDAFKVKRGALSYRISNTIDKLAQPRSKPPASSPESSGSASKNATSATGKQTQRKLVNSNELSNKKGFLLDTYARITANYNKRCPKRLRELSKAKNASSERGDLRVGFANGAAGYKRYDPNHGSVEKRRK